MDFQRQQKPAQLLFVEDNPGDVRLTEQALQDGEKFNLHIVSDGEKALNFLNRIGEYENAPIPDLILLDLNLPKKDGREVLADVKADEDLKRIPVVVLTSSKAEEDIIKVYNLNANCYITKPVNFNHFIVQSNGAIIGCASDDNGNELTYAIARDGSVKHRRNQGRWKDLSVLDAAGIRYLAGQFYNKSVPTYKTNSRLTYR